MSGAQDIVATASAAGYSKFISALETAGLSGVLTGAGPFTVFAPTDAAFDALPAMTKLLAGDKAQLKAVLSHHFAKGRVMTSRFDGKRIRAKTYAGGSVLVDGTQGLSVDGARVVAPDIEASNGVIHGIDSVLWPRAADVVAGSA